jgi:hypothetical protein
VHHHLVALRGAGLVLMTRDRLFVPRREVLDEVMPALLRYLGDRT